MSIITVAEPGHKVKVYKARQVWIGKHRVTWLPPKGCVRKYVLLRHAQTTVMVENA